MIFKERIKIILVILYILSPTSSYAGVEGKMQDFLGNNSNYSAGGRYKSQSRGYFASPSIYSRNAIVDIKPVNITMPSFRSGCGGIDMFAGSFSHINADQFLALLRAIPQNAKGYVFRLAMDAISPTINDALGDMENIMREINNTNLNSCEISKGIINTSLSQFDKGAEMVCVRQQMDRGLAQDLAEAKKNCTSGGQKSSTLGSSNEGQDSAIVDINYAWNAISKLTTDNDLREFIQTITGTIIVAKPANDDANPVVKTYPSLVRDPSTFDALFYGGTMKKYSCDDFVKCLNINDSDTQTISSGSAFFSRIQTVLNSVSGKMKVRNEELTDEEGELISVTDVPVVAILRTYQRYYSSEMNSMVSDSLSEIVAHDLLNNFMGDLLAHVERISKNNDNKVDEMRLKKFHESIKDTQRILSQKEFQMQQKRKQLLEEVDRARAIEHEASNILIGKMYTNTQ